MLEDIDRHVLFHKIHWAVEETAKATAMNLCNGSPELTYPPNCGFTQGEAAALKAIARSPDMLSALRKVIADAAIFPMFHVLCIAEGVVDPATIEETEKDRGSTELSLHDGIYDSYWAWLDRRPNPGWRLDTYTDS